MNIADNLNEIHLKIASLEALPMEKMIKMIKTMLTSKDYQNIESLS